MNIAQVYSNIGNVLWMKKEFEESIKMKEKSLYLWSEILDKNHPNILLIESEIKMMKNN